MPALIEGRGDMAGDAGNELRWPLSLRYSGIAPASIELGRQGQQFRPLVSIWRKSIPGVLCDLNEAADNNDDLTS